MLKKYALIPVCFFIMVTCISTLAMEKDEHKYLYCDSDGIYSIKSEYEVNEAELEKLTLNSDTMLSKKSYWKLTREKNILLKLLDKYFYKKARHKKYERDISLGMNDKDTLKRKQISLNNLTTLKKAMALIYPLWQINNADVPTNEMPDNILEEYLDRKMQESGRYFGDELSDNSDYEDKAGYLKEKKTKKVQRHKNIAALQAEAGFWLTTRRITPNVSPQKSKGDKKYNAGLAGKLAALVDKHKARIVTDDHILAVLAGRKGTKTKKAITRLDETTLKKDLQKRASVEHGVNPTTQYDIATINAWIIKNGPLTIEILKELEKKKLIQTKFFIAQYRGINYMTDRWSADARRYHREMDEVGMPQYSEVILKTLPYCVYTELDSEHNFVKNTHEKQALFMQAVRFKKFAHALENSGPCINYSDDAQKNPYFFNNIGDCLQHRFSNGIDEHLRNIQVLRTKYPNYWGKNLSSAHNGAIATGDRPYHALKYTYGLKKYYKHPLYPRYNCDGSLEYSHAGKVYVSLHTLEEFVGSDKPNQVSQMDRLGQIALGDQIAPEKETSFSGFIPAGKIFYQHVAKYPSFKLGYDGEIETMLAIKYGLDKSLYESFQYLIGISKPETELRYAVIDLLSEWLCAYHEVLLIKIARQEATKRNGVLVYLNRDGMLSLEPDEGRIFTGYDANAPLRNTVHILRGVRKHLANTINADKKITKDRESFPGFTIVKDASLESFKENIVADPKILERIAKAVKTTKQQESALYLQSLDEHTLKQAEALKVIHAEYDKTFFVPCGRYVMPQLIDPDHLYEEMEINALLQNYARTQQAGYTARVLAATHPLITGPMQAHSRLDFISRVRLAFQSGIPAIIPINITQENPDNLDEMAGTHWVGLIIRSTSNNHFTIEYLDSLNSPPQNSLFAELQLEQEDPLHDLAQLINEAAHEAHVEITLSVLHAAQQTADVDCGAWLVDNLIRRVNNQPLRTNAQISGRELRLEHAQLEATPITDLLPSVLPNTSLKGAHAAGKKS